MTRKKPPEPPTSADIITNEIQVQLALRAAREALQRLNIPEISLGEYRASNLRMYRFYEDRGNDIVLGIELNPLTSSGIIHCSLHQTVLEILYDLENLLSEPAGCELFELEGSEINEFLYKNLVDLTAVYLLQLPIVLYHAFYQAVNESIVSHLKAVIEPVYSEDWLKRGKRKGFSMVPTKRVGDLVKLFPGVEFRLFNYVGIEDGELSEYRKAVLSKQGIQRNPHRMSNLHVEYDLLRAQFSKVKKEYVKEREAFSRVFPRAQEEEWISHWNGYLNRTFPALYYSEIDVERTPSELAYRHLGEILEYHPDTVEVKVRTARAIARERSRIERTKVT